jgi:hypothetical protein
MGWCTSLKLTVDELAHAEVCFLSSSTTGPIRHLGNAVSTRVR